MSRESSPRAGRIPARVVVWLAIAAMPATLGWLAAEVYLTQNNTLFANGRWVSSKVGLDRGLMGAYAFVTERQALAGGALHLNAWHGFNEVSSGHPVEGLRSVEFDLTLGHGGYAVVSLKPADLEKPRAAVRLSTHWRHPPAALRVDSEGRFLSRHYFRKGLTDKNVTHRVTLDLEPGRALAKLDGVELGAVELVEAAGHFVGFRSGKHPASIDNVVFRTADNRFEETFSVPKKAWQVRLGVVGTILLGNLLLGYGLKRRFVGKSRQAMFMFLTANLTLIAIGALLFFFVVQRASWYPGLNEVLEEREEYFRKGEVETVLSTLDRRYSRKEVRHKTGILFVGSSQTWGAGALDEKDTFVARLERLLNEDRHEQPFVCVNMGVSSAKARDLVRLVRQEVDRLRPEMVVINLSSNDRTSGGFDLQMRKLLVFAGRRGATVVLMKEANSPATADRGLRRRHADLEALAAEFGAPVIDMHEHLTGLVDTGFLWWDQVHLTSYGQRLVAEKLFEELGPRLAKEVVFSAGSGSNSGNKKGRRDAPAVKFR